MKKLLMLLLCGSMLIFAVLLFGILPVLIMIMVSY